jgi:hypothetical protein
MEGSGSGRQACQTKGVGLAAGVLICVSLATSACSDKETVPPIVIDEPQACPDIPGPPLRLLTRFEYNNSVRDLLGDSSGPARDFPREPLANGLDNDATLNQVGDENVLRYLEASESLAKVAVANTALAMPICTAAPCAEKFISEFGQRLFRRPLTTDESLGMQPLFSAALAKQDAQGAMETTLAALLQSPQFVYRDEWGTSAIGTSALRLSGHQIASKLSYFVFGTTPDAVLQQAATQGELNTAAGVAQTANKMVNDARGMDGLARFLSQWLYLDGVQNTEKDIYTFTDFSRELAKSWRTSLEMFVSNSLVETHSLKGLLTSPALFVDSKMTGYGAEVVFANNTEFRQTVQAPGRATGILGQPGFLAFKSLHNGSSPIRRGIFVLDKLLCEPPPPPPADVPIVPPPLSKSLTTRERFDNHRKDPTCASCHNVIDPVGFAFEHYDGMGRWRATENGQPINAQGGIVTANDESLIGMGDGLEPMIEKLVQSRQVHDCVAREVYRYAVGRPLLHEDECWLKEITDNFMKSGGDFKTLIVSIASSPSFQRHSFKAIGDQP